MGFSPWIEAKSHILVSEQNTTFLNSISQATRRWHIKIITHVVDSSTLKGEGERARPKTLGRQSQVTENFGNLGIYRQRKTRKVKKKRYCDFIFWASDTIMVNPCLPSGPVHPYHLEESISQYKGCLVYLFIFIRFFVEISVCKQ